MALPVDDLSVSQALVVDSNPTSRSILVSQLRDFGMGSVVQCARLADARRQLEYRFFDVVLCEHHFANQATSGQDFLDDLRRNQTPASIRRLQNLGMMSYYAGERQEAEKVLDRTARLGLDSKMFGCQTLVLLAFVRLESGDRKGLQRCRDDFSRLIDKNPKNERRQRLSSIVDVLSSIQQSQFAHAVDAIRNMARTVKSPGFDFESASNQLALMAQLANKAIQLNEVESFVDTLALRFCTNIALSELLAGSAAIHPPYAERVRAAHGQVLKITEYAVSRSMGGDPQASVRHLLFHGNATLNAKLIETAYLVLHRYADKIADASSLGQAVQELRTRFATSSSRTALGDQRRQAGGLTLRVGTAPAKAASAVATG